nr:uncharacterized protein LOC120342882 isoform X4 [Styela clava]
MSRKIAVFVLAMMICSFGLTRAKSLESRNQSGKSSKTVDNKDHERFWWIPLVVKIVNAVERGDQSDEASKTFDNKDQERFWWIPIVDEIVRAVKRG